VSSDDYIHISTVRELICDGDYDDLIDELIYQGEFDETIYNYLELSIDDDEILKKIKKALYL